MFAYFVVLAFFGWFDAVFLGFGICDLFSWVGWLFVLGYDDWFLGCYNTGLLVFLLVCGFLVWSFVLCGWLFCVFVVFGYFLVLRFGFVCFVPGVCWHFVDCYSELGFF